MLNKIKNKIKNKHEILALSILIIATVFFTSYYNYTKEKINKNYKEIINNIYFKKSITHLFQNLEPKFKKVEHKISKGETFDSILKDYSVSNDEIEDIKKKHQK